MDKQHFYVSVHGRSVLAEQGAAPYELVMYCTVGQAREVQQMMEDMQEHAEDSFLAYTFPWPDTPEDHVNSQYTESLNKLYRKIYEYGTAETRQHLTENKMLGYT